jgi:hypothetical protein
VKLIRASKEASSPAEGFLFLNDNFFTYEGSNATGHWHRRRNRGGASAN